MATFEEIVRSRRDWIETVLKPWCQSASRRELILAEIEWPNLAGKVDPEKSLWSWAWSRFPALMHEGIAGINETEQVQVVLHDGTTTTGYPDARRSLQGELLLVIRDNATGQWSDAGPFRLDDIAGINRV